MKHSLSSSHCSFIAHLYLKFTAMFCKGGDLRSIVVILLRAVLWQSGKEVGEWSGAPHLECRGAGEDGLAHLHQIFDGLALGIA